MENRLKIAGTIIIIGFAVIGVCVVGWHVWVDHTSLHQLVGAMNTIAAKHPEIFK